MYFITLLTHTSKQNCTEDRCQKFHEFNQIGWLATNNKIFPFENVNYWNVESYELWSCLHHEWDCRHSEWCLVLFTPNVNSTTELLFPITQNLKVVFFSFYFSLLLQSLLRSCAVVQRGPLHLPSLAALKFNELHNYSSSSSSSV